MKRRNVWVAALGLALAAAAWSANLQAQSPCCEPAEEETVSYGPCPCESRGTLMQWSYGTSFEGGPPGADEPLVTDRPDFTEASTTVGLGVVQLETGYTFTSDDDGVSRTDTHSYPEMLFRIGVLADWLELRIAFNYANEEVTNGVARTDVSGFEDLYLGAKIALTPQEGILPEMALMPQMTVPAGSDEFTADEVLPGVNWLYGWDINDFISTGGSSQINKAIDGDDDYVEFAQSWTVGYSLSDNIGAYTEWFAFIPSGADDAETEHYFNGGFTFLWNNDVQFDIRAGVGLNDAADDYFVGAGAAFRFN